MWSRCDVNIQECYRSRARLIRIDAFTMVWSDFFSDPWNKFKNQFENRSPSNIDYDRTNWHKDIKWHSLEEGFAKAKETGKPLAVIIKSKDCPACKKLSENIRQSYFLPETAKDFVMVVTEFSEIPDDVKFFPDGRYIPRILFYDSQGKLMPHYYNQYGHSMKKYFYWDAWLVIDTMLQIIKDKNKWL